MQIAFGEAVAATTGIELTLIATEADDEQPFELTPVTENTDVVTGETITELPDRLSGIHVYEFAPVAPKVED